MELSEICNAVIWILDPLLEINLDQTGATEIKEYNQGVISWTADGVNKQSRFR